MENWLQQVLIFLTNKIIFFPLILFAFLTLRYFLISGGMYLILWKFFKDSLKGRRIQNGPLIKNQIAIEIKYSLISFFAMSVATWPLVYLFIQGKTAIYLSHDLYSVPWIILSVVIGLLWHDIYFYFSHRLLHTRWAYKKIHKIHHISRIPTPFASHSFHWGEGVLQILFIYLIVLFIPMHPYTFIFFMALSHFFACWGHFNYELMPFSTWNSWWGSWVTTSTHHNDHHKYHDQGNYGLYLKYWDVIFKTLNTNTRKKFSLKR